MNRLIIILTGVIISALPHMYTAGAHEKFNEKFYIDASGKNFSFDKHSAEEENLEGVSVEEKPGIKIRGDAVFLDENGKRIKISEYASKPVLILPVYYYCPQACGVILANLANALNGVPMEAGKDYRVLALSIDPDEDPAAALRAKKNYTRLLKKDFPQEEWKFLTGDEKNIRLLTDSAGYRFKKISRHEFAHPLVLIVISHDGTIIRYLYGPAFLPFDIGMALTEAEKGTPSISVRKLLSYCFTYDPGKRTYTFTIVRFIVAGILVIIGIFLFFLIRKKS